MTDENDNKPKGPGGYREAPPGAPPPPPVQPLPLQKQLQDEAELRQFRAQVHGPTQSPHAKTAAMAGLGCLGIFLWLAALAGVGVLVMVGMVIYTCSR